MERGGERMSAYTIHLSKPSIGLDAYLVEVSESGVIIGDGRGATRRAAIIEALEDAGIL